MRNRRITSNGSYACHNPPINHSRPNNTYDIKMSLGPLDTLRLTRKLWQLIKLIPNDASLWIIRFFFCFLFCFVLFFFCFFFVFFFYFFFFFLDYPILMKRMMYDDKTQIPLKDGINQSDRIHTSSIWNVRITISYKVLGRFH